MLPRIVLLALQLLAAWALVDWFALPLIRNVPALARPYDVFAYAIVYSAIIMIVGYSGSLILKDVPKPSGATLIVTFVLALVLAGLTLVPAVTQIVNGIVPSLRTNLYVYPLVGALAGYYLRR